MNRIFLCLLLMLAGCTSLVPSGSGKRPKISYDEAYAKADSYVKKHNVIWSSLLKTTQNEDAYFFHYSLEHDDVAHLFRRTLRVDKTSGRVKVLNDFR